MPAGLLLHHIEGFHRANCTWLSVLLTHLPADIGRCVPRAARSITQPPLVPQVKNFARVADSIIGWGSSIGRWARIDNKSVIGEDVHIKVRPTST